MPKLRARVNQILRALRFVAPAGFYRSIQPIVTFLRKWLFRIAVSAIRADRDFLPTIARTQSIISLSRVPHPYRSLSREIKCSENQSRFSKQRSVIFLHNSYYQFYYLAAALRRRGWDAQLVTMHSADNSSVNFFHGEDLNVYDSDPIRFERKLYRLYWDIQKRFKMVHFAGQHLMSVFPTNFDAFDSAARVPWDFLEFKRQGKLIGYTVSGCSDGQAQSVLQRQTRICEKCIWQLHPKVCSDEINLSWAAKLQAICDLVSCENDWSLDQRQGEQNFHEPLTSCLDSELWNPSISIPKHLRIERGADELLILHAFGNADQRANRGRDIKGSSAIRAAVDRLREDGFKVKLLAVSNVKSSEMKFIQAQADIIVDQLNYGRYGAQARESMMLGKPTICHINKKAEPLTLSLSECPLIDADENSVYDVLKRLVLFPEERLATGVLSRAYALKWHSSDACAERFERVYDALLAGVSPARFELSAFASPSTDRSASRLLSKSNSELRCAGAQQ